MQQRSALGIEWMTQAHDHPELWRDLGADHLEAEL
jgi:hypothetical protein